MPVPQEFPQYVLRYAEAVLQNAAMGNFNAAEGILGSARMDLVKAGDAAALGNLLVLVALNTLKLPGRTGDVLGVSLIEFIRSLAEDGNIQLRVRVAKTVADGLRDIIEKLPLDSFAATSIKFVFVGALCIVAIAEGNKEEAARMAQMIDENTGGQFKFGSLVHP